MAMSDNLTAANTKELVAQAKATNQKLDAILVELQGLNERLGQLVVADKLSS